jgi:hypothetical protein
MFFTDIMTMKPRELFKATEETDRSTQVQLTGAPRNQTHDDTSSNYAAAEGEAFSCRDGMRSTCRAFRERRQDDRLRAGKSGAKQTTAPQSFAGATTQVYAF